MKEWLLLVPVTCCAWQFVSHIWSDFCNESPPHHCPKLVFCSCMHICCDSLIIFVIDITVAAHKTLLLIPKWLLAEKTSSNYNIKGWFCALVCLEHGQCIAWGLLCMTQRSFQKTKESQRIQIDSFLIVFFIQTLWRCSQEVFNVTAARQRCREMEATSPQCRSH